MDTRSEKVYAVVSAQVSAGDGIPFDFVGPQPPASTGPGNSNVQMFMLEFMRRMCTYVMSPSASLNSGGSAGSVALNYGTAAPVSGLFGMYQGVPFYLSAAGTPSAAPTSLVSTTSGQIRKVLVTVGMSTLGSNVPNSSLALAGGTVQFVYGSAFATSGGAVTSGGQTLSYFDSVPLPMPSAGEVPVGWLNIPNSFATSAGISASMMFSDYRAIQGLNLSAMMVGMAQP